MQMVFLTWILFQIHVLLFCIPFIILLLFFMCKKKFSAKLSCYQNTASLPLLPFNLKYSDQCRELIVLTTLLPPVFNSVTTILVHCWDLCLRTAQANLQQECSVVSTSTFFKIPSYDTFYLYKYVGKYPCSNFKILFIFQAQCAFLTFNTS